MSELKSVKECFEEQDYIDDFNNKKQEIIEAQNRLIKDGYGKITNFYYNDIDAAKTDMLLNVEVYTACLIRMKNNKGFKISYNIEKKEDQEEDLKRYVGNLYLIYDVNNIQICKKKSL